MALMPKSVDDAIRKLFGDDTEGVPPPPPPSPPPVPANADEAINAVFDEKLNSRLLEKSREMLREKQPGPDANARENFGALMTNVLRHWRATDLLKESPGKYDAGLKQFDADLAAGAQSTIIQRISDIVMKQDCLNPDNPTTEDLAYQQRFFEMMGQMQEGNFAPGTVQRPQKTPMPDVIGGASKLFAALDYPSEKLPRTLIWSLLSRTKTGTWEERQKAQDVASALTAGPRALMEPAGFGKAASESIEKGILGREPELPPEEKGRRTGLGGWLQPHDVPATEEIPAEHREEWVRMKAKEGIINNLFSEGYPWYVSIPFGFVAEAVIDPLNIVGAGLGRVFRAVTGGGADVVQQAGRGGAGEFFEQAARRGADLPPIEGVAGATRESIGVNVRNVLGGGRGKTLVPPLSEEAVNFVKQNEHVRRVADFVTGLFTPAGRPKGKHLSYLATWFGDAEAAKINLEIGRAIKPHQTKLMELCEIARHQYGQNWQNRIKWSMSAVADIGPAERGFPGAAARIRACNLDDIQMEFANTIHDAIEACGESYTRVSGEKIPELSGVFKRKVLGQIEEAETEMEKLHAAIVPQEKKYSEIISTARAAEEKQLASAERTLSSYDELKATLMATERSLETAGVTMPRKTLLEHLLAREKTIMEEAAEGGRKLAEAKKVWGESGTALEFTQPARAVKAGEQVVRVDVGLLEKDWRKSGYYVGKGGAGQSAIPGRYETLAGSLAKTPNAPIEMPELNLSGGEVMFKDGRTRFALLRDMGVEQIDVSVPAAEADEFATRFGAKARKVDLPEYMSAESLLEGPVTTGWAKEPFKDPKEIRAQITTLSNRISDMDEALKKTESMTPKNLQTLMRQAGFKGKTLETLEPVADTLGKLRMERTRQQYKASLLKRVLNDEITPARAEALSENMDDVLSHAGKTAMSWGERPDYMPQVTPEHAKFTGRGGAQTIDPLAHTRGFQERHFLRKDGIPKTPLEINDEIVAMVRDPEGVTKHPDMVKILSRAYGDKSWEDTIKAVRRDIDKGRAPVWKMIESNPEAVVKAHISSLASEAGRESIAKNLYAYASDVQINDFWVPSKSVSDRLGRMYPGKFFPPEIADQYAQWDRSITTMQRVFAARENPLYKAVMTWNNVWKATQTGWRPGFQFRNMIDDLARFYSEGAYNPVQLLEYGTRAVAKSGSMDLGGNIGRVTGEQALELVRAFNIDYAGQMDEALGFLGKGKLSFLHDPERVRRAGHFLVRVKEYNDAGFTEDACLRAAISTRRVAFPADNLAAWERVVRDVAIPFYSFRRQSLGWASNQLMSNPGFVHAMLQIPESMKKRTGGELPPFQALGPEYLRDRAIHAMRGDTGTSILTMSGMSYDEMEWILDAAGDPKEAALRTFTKDGAWKLTREFTPALGDIGNIGKNAVTEFYNKVLGRPSGWEGGNVPVPTEWLVLPDDTLKALGASNKWKKMELGAGKTVAERSIAYEEWQIPKRRLDLYKTFGFYNEFARWLKPESITKSATLVGTDSLFWKVATNPESLRNALTGITEYKSTDAEIAMGMFRDWREHVENYMQMKGLMRDRSVPAEQIKPVVHKGRTVVEGTNIWKLYTALKKGENDLQEYVSMERYFERAKRYGFPAERQGEQFFEER